MSDNCADLIDYIVEIRKQKGMTQSELAQAANLAQPAIARMERKTITPQLDTFLKVLSALGQEVKVIPKSE